MSRLCECGRPALFNPNAGKNNYWHADKNHPLCRQCYVSQMQAFNAAQKMRDAEEAEDEVHSVHTGISGGHPTDL